MRRASQSSSSHVYKFFKLAVFHSSFPLKTFNNLFINCWTIKNCKKVPEMPLTRKDKAKNYFPSSGVVDEGAAGADNNDDRSPPTGAKLKAMSDAILKTINDRFDQFEIKFIAPQSFHNILNARMDSMDETASDHESRLVAMEKVICDLKVENSRLQAKTNDLEGRPHRKKY